MAAALGLQIAGTEDEMPVDSWWIADLKESGWSLLWCEDEEFGARSHDRMADLSKRSDVLHCQVNETVMWSSSELWSKGSVVWKVSHSGDAGDVFDLNAEGALPDQFDGIKEQHFHDQRTDEEDDCDFVFEVPLDLAKSFIGFRHEDMLDENSVGAFSVVDTPRKAGFLSRLLGR